MSKSYPPNLTPDECEQFTLLNFLAFDIARNEAKHDDKRIPAFLCTSGEAKTRYQAKAIAILNEQCDIVVPFNVNDLPRVEKFLAEKLPLQMVQKLQDWIDAESELKIARNHNPKAWFV